MTGARTRRRPGLLVVPDRRTPEDLDAFWDGYEDRLRGYAWHLLDLRRIPTGRADVDDVTSEVYLQLRERWPAVRNPVAFARSQAAAAVFAALREETRRGRPHHLLADGDVRRADGRPQDPGPDETVLDEIVDQSVREALPASLDQLTRKQRAAVELSTQGDMTREEVAAGVGASAGAVSSHRARGLRKLHTQLLPLVMSFVKVATLAVALLVGPLISASVAKLLPPWARTVLEVIGWAIAGLCGLGFLVLLLVLAQQYWDEHR